MQSDKYKAKVECENCGFIGEAEFPKGTRLNYNECPNCGLEHYLKVYDIWKRY